MADQPNPQHDEPEAPLPRELRKVVEQIALQTPSDERIRRILAKSQAALNAATVQAAASRPATPLRSWARRWTSLAVAASLGAVAIGWWFHTNRTATTPIAQDRPIQAIPNPAPVPATDAGEELPTVWACNRALRESPESLEAFLDRAALPSVGKPLLARNLASADLADQTL